MSGETTGLETDEDKQYFLDDRYRLQRYLSNAAVVAIDDKVVNTRTVSENASWTYDCNIHLARFRKKHR